MFLNYDDAIEYVLRIPDAQVREMVSMALRCYELLVLEGVKPSHDLDLLFVAKGLESLMRQKEKLKHVLDGKSLSWPE